ncbi:MAG: hypothetical protein KDD21_03255 [Bacteroidetes bacterium]|nr:hypothetical protein [Bacteroidota bacterium]
MKKIYTLRNILALLFLFFVVSCNKDKSELHTISSEDKDYQEYTSVKRYMDKETGQVYYVITKD